MKEKEIYIPAHEVLVSATDEHGNIRYANENFCKTCEYEYKDLLGKPHNIIRHPEMPMAIFGLLWERVLSGKHIYAFVKNRTKTGKFYWVKAYVAPKIKKGKIEKIISYRKPISKKMQGMIEPLYEEMLLLEKEHGSYEKSLDFLNDFLGKRTMSYDQLIDRISLEKEISSAELLSLDVTFYKVSHILLKLRVFRELGNKKENISVPKSWECAFGKWIESVKNHPFAKSKEFLEIIKLHESVHSELEYCAKNPQETREQVASLEEELKKTTKSIFAKLQHIIDTTKE